MIDLTYPFKYGEFSSVHVVKNLTNGCTRLVKKTWMSLRNYFRQIFQKCLFYYAYEKEDFLLHGFFQPRTKNRVKLPFSAAILIMQSLGFL